MSTELPDHARQVLESRFLDQAKKADAQAHVDHDLDKKIAHLKGNSDVIRKLRDLSGQASELWRERSKLSGKHLLYLTAGLLYFISPVDAVTDLLPVLGYIDDVAVLAWILSQIAPALNKVKDQVVEAKDATIHQATDQLVEKGRDALNEVVDERTDELLEKLDAKAEDIVQRYVTAVVIGLWGTTTAAAMSLVVSLITGGYTREWMAYVGITSLLVLAWNITVGISFWRHFRQLDERWQKALPRQLGARIGRWRHLLAVALPLLAFGALAVAHLSLN